MCRQQESLDPKDIGSIENYTSSYQTHVTEVVKDKCLGVGIYFLIDIVLFINNGWISKIFIKKNISLRCHLPP